MSEYTAVLIITIFSGLPGSGVSNQIHSVPMGNMDVCMAAVESLEKRSFKTSLGFEGRSHYGNTRYLDCVSTVSGAVE